ncbi:hypothetical protein SAFG77S_09712 [Streptomyces afghaniensis]
MKKISITLFIVFLLGITACSKSSIDDSNNNKSEPNNTSSNTDTFNDSATDENSINNPEKEDHIEPNNNSDKEFSTNSISEVKENEIKPETSTPDKMNKKREEVLDNIQKELTALPDKIEGSRQEFLERLDSIQRELDSLPDKKYSDTGTTNAMKNYYGISDEKYDIALNRIYDLLKKELSPKTMESLQMEEIKWIEQKEAEADKERQKYAGKTHEWVAYYISSYELTKERCYELVNKFITD